ncbi:MAG: metallophosphoesterase [Gemmatimonadota bacterium]|nr:MAG: metallophosphoesterase [Gemmatimonadota bacterium]
MKMIGIRIGSALLALSIAACGPRRFPDVSPPPQVNPRAEAVVYLIGDVGEASQQDAVLAQLKADIRKRTQYAQVIVAFLGDNVYHRGLHPPYHADHDEDMARLEVQIDVLRGTDATGVFLPGNHDWGYGDERGLDQLRRQGDRLATAALDGVAVTLLPEAGCPGPRALTVGKSALLVMIDTDFWLRDDVPIEGCEHRSTDEALVGLRSILSQNARGDRRHVVVLGHHPLKTYGPHGGYFGLKDQFFPGTNLWAPLYVPLPFLYPIVRNSGISKQDLSNNRNAAMRTQIGQALSETPDHNIVYAAGHDHNLQVFEGGDYGVRYILVSGAGSKLTDVGQDDALFAAGKQNRELGYMRLDFFDDGGVLLSAVTDGTVACGGSPDCKPEASVRYWRWLVEENVSAVE